MNLRAAVSWGVAIVVQLVNGTLEIPEEILQRCGLEDGDEVLLDTMPQRTIVIRPVPELVKAPSVLSLEQCAAAVLDNAVSPDDYQAGRDFVQRVLGRDPDSIDHQRPTP